MYNIQKLPAITHASNRRAALSAVQRNAPRLQKRCALVYLRQGYALCKRGVIHVRQLVKMGYSALFVFLFHILSLCLV